MSSFEDKTLTCVDCGAEFIHSADAQERFSELGFADPKRCLNCRRERKRSGGGGGGGGGGEWRSGTGGGGGHGGGGGDRSRGPRVEHEVVCAECGVTTTVPFEPRGDRPVYCRDCYRRQ